MLAQCWLQGFFQRQNVASADDSLLGKRATTLKILATIVPRFFQSKPIRKMSSGPGAEILSSEFRTVRPAELYRV